MRPAIAHTMLRVVDLERALAFYHGALGMELVRREDYPEGEFTLVFLGFDGPSGVTLELTHNWGRERAYAHGEGFGHVAILVDDLEEVCDRVTGSGFDVTRRPGPMKYGAKAERIAFVRDADGYAVELLQRV